MSAEEVARVVEDQLRDELARAAETRLGARPVVRAIEDRWPERLGPVSIATDGSCGVLLHAIFEVVLRPDGSRVSAQVRGWDRDLTDCVVGDPSSPLEQVPALVDRVARVIEDLRPAAELIAPRAMPPTRTSPSRLGTAAALAARAARDRGEDPDDPLIDHDRLGELLHERWPAADVREHRRGGELVEFFLRPYGSSRVVVSAEPKGGLGAGACIGTAVDSTMIETALLARRDEAHTRDLTRALDRWLCATMPPSWIAARPVVGAP